MKRVSPPGSHHRDIYIFFYYKGLDKILGGIFMCIGSGFDAWQLDGKVWLMKVRDCVYDYYYYYCFFIELWIHLSFIIFFYFLFLWTGLQALASKRKPNPIRISS